MCVCVCVCVCVCLVPVNSALEHVGYTFVLCSRRMVNIPELQGKDICQFECML